MESTPPPPREGREEARAGGLPGGGLLDSRYPTISCPLTAMDREAWDRRDGGEVAVCWPCGPILARSLVSFGREDVLQTLKNEVMARKNPDFWLCSTKPKVVATPGPYVLVAAFGAEEGVLSSSCHPLGVWVTDSLVSFLFLIAQMGRLRRRDETCCRARAGQDPGGGLTVLLSFCPDPLGFPQRTGEFCHLPFEADGKYQRCPSGRATVRAQTQDPHTSRTFLLPGSFPVVWRGACGTG